MRRLILLLAAAGALVGADAWAATARPHAATISSSLGTITVVGVDGSAKRRLTPPDRFDGPPSISPDGRLLAFETIARARAGEAGLRSVVGVMSIGGSQFRTYAPEIHQPTAFAWSADGRGVAFSSRSRNRAYVADLAAGRIVPLPVRAAFAAGWSRDGRLALAGGRGTVVVDAAGAELWRDPGSFGGWSPDGRRLLVRRGDGSLIVLDRDGRRLLALARVLPQPAPSWSPDGRTISFAHGARSSLWVATLATGQTRRLASATGGWPPAWSPDGSRLAYADTSSRTIVATVAGAHAGGALPGRLPLAWVDGRRLLTVRTETEGERIWEVLGLRDAGATRWRASPRRRRSGRSCHRTGARSSSSRRSASGRGAAARVAPASRGRAGRAAPSAAVPCARGSGGRAPASGSS